MVVEAPLQLVRELAEIDQELQSKGYSRPLQRRFDLWWRKSLRPWERSLSDRERESAEIFDSAEWLGRRLHFARDGMTVEVVDMDLSHERYKQITDSATGVCVELLADSAECRRIVLSWHPK